MYPVPFTLRKAKNDYAVPGTDIVIDKGIRLIIPIYGIHYDPAIYENPEKFDPDRFESSVKSNRDSMAWLPFGNGPRIWFVIETSITLLVNINIQRKIILSGFVFELL